MTPSLNFGRYKNLPLTQVPASYLLWVYTNCSGVDFYCHQWIKSNLEDLEYKAKAENTPRRHRRRRNEDYSSEGERQAMQRYGL